MEVVTGPCPKCGGTKFIHGSDGTARYAAVARVCRTCYHVETRVVDLDAEEVTPS
jgi:hypothetical protein